MKPFFSSFFKPLFGSALPTRIGPIIGKSNERKMLEAVGGPDGTRKKLRVNADGSTTMLKTRAGMPQFSTVKTNTAITVSNGFAVVVQDPLISHTITVPGAGTYTIVFADGPSSYGTYFGVYLSDGQMTNGVTVASGPTTGVLGATTSTTATITVPSGVTSFEINYELSGGAYYDGTAITYSLTVSSGGTSGAGQGEIVGWCTFYYVSPEDDFDAYSAWASRCI